MNLLPLSYACRAVLSVLLVAGCSDAPESAPNPLHLVLADSNASVPTTAVNESDGSVVFSWFGKDDAGRATVQVARLGSADTVASGTVRVNPREVTVNAHGQAPAQLAVARDGTIYVAWSTRQVIEGRRFPASNLVVGRSLDGGRSFEEPVFVNDDAYGEPAGHTFHDLAVGRDGTVYVSWLDSRNPETQVRVATSGDRGETFSQSVVVANGTCECCRTTLAAHQTGVYLAWRHIFGDNIRDIAFARSDDNGRTFTEPTRVRKDGWKIEGCPHSGPSLAVDPVGAVHIAWYTAVPDMAGLHYAVSTDRGGTFAGERYLIGDVPIAQARLASAAWDGVWVVWEDPLADHFYAGLVHDAETPLSFSGSAPAVAATANVRSFVWQNDGGIEASVERRRP